MLADLLGEFEWPAPYVLKEVRQGTIEMAFPRCRLLFTEGYESEVDLLFLPENTGLKLPVSVYKILLARGGVDTPGMSDFYSPEASLEKVQHDVRDLCVTLLYHFRSSILGSFSWLPAYREHLEHLEKIRAQNQ